MLLQYSKYRDLRFTRKIYSLLFVVLHLPDKRNVIHGAKKFNIEIFPPWWFGCVAELYWWDCLGLAFAEWYCWLWRARRGCCCCDCPFFALYGTPRIWPTAILYVVISRPIPRAFRWIPSCWWVSLWASFMVGKDMTEGGDSDWVNWRMYSSTLLLYVSVALRDSSLRGSGCRRNILAAGNLAWHSARRELVAAMVSTTEVEDWARLFSATCRITTRGLRSDDRTYSVAPWTVLFCSIITLADLFLYILSDLIWAVFKFPMIRRSGWWWWTGNGLEFSASSWFIEGEMGSLSASVSITSFWCVLRCSCRRRELSL